MSTGGMVPNNLPRSIVLPDGRVAPLYWRQTGFYRRKAKLPAMTTEQIKGLTAEALLPLLETKDEWVELWLPVLPPEYATAANVDAIYSSVYGRIENTEEFFQLSPDDLAESRMDYQQFLNTSPYLSLEATIAENPDLAGALNLADVKDFTLRQAEFLLRGRAFDRNKFYQEVQKVESFPEYIDTLRFRNEAQGELPPQFTARDLQRGEALAGAFGKTAEFPTDEVKQLENTVKILTPIAEEAQRKVKAGILDPDKPITLQEQQQIASIKGLETAQIRLNDIRLQPSREQLLASGGKSGQGRSILGLSPFQEIRTTEKVQSFVPPFKSEPEVKLSSEEIAKRQRMALLKQQAREASMYRQRKATI